MRVIKRNPDLLKSVVIMDKGCGHMDYYGCMIMRDGFSYCRQCIYNIWAKESNYKWQPDPNKEYTFPLYSDGKDYFTSYDKPEKLRR